MVVGGNTMEQTAKLTKSPQLDSVGDFMGKWWEEVILCKNCQADKTSPARQCWWIYEKMMAGGSALQEFIKVMKTSQLDTVGEFMEKWWHEVVPCTKLLRWWNLLHLIVLAISRKKYNILQEAAKVMKPLPLDSVGDFMKKGGKR